MIGRKNLKVSSQPNGDAAGWDCNTDSALASFLAKRDGVYLISLHQTVVGAGGHTVGFHREGSTMRYYDPNTGMWVVDNETDIAAQLSASRQLIGHKHTNSTVEELACE